MSEKLLPCPFCGNIPTRVKPYSEFSSPRVTCPNSSCILYGNAFWVDHWNTRSTHKPEGAQLNDLLSALDKAPTFVTRFSDPLERIRRAVHACFEWEKLADQFCNRKEGDADAASIPLTKAPEVTKGAQFSDTEILDWIQKAAFVRWPFGNAVYFNFAVITSVDNGWTELPTIRQAATSAMLSAREEGEK